MTAVLNMDDITCLRHRNKAMLKAFTYRDYLSWDNDVGCELIDGVPYMMTSSTEWHQWVCGEIFIQLGIQLKGKHCRVYIPPFDVRLFPEAD